MSYQKINCYSVPFQDYQKATNEILSRNLQTFCDRIIKNIPPRNKKGTEYTKNNIILYRKVKLQRLLSLTGNWSTVVCNNTIATSL